MTDGSTRRFLHVAQGEVDQGSHGIFGFGRIALVYGIENQAMIGDRIAREISDPVFDQRGP
jgi:hypothetical protein